MSSFPAKSVIISNLRNVTVRGVQMHCHALVISDDPDLHEGKERRFSLNGYGASCVWHVFTLRLRSANYKWDEAPQILTVDEHDQPSPTELRLGVENWDLPIRFDVIEGSWTPGERRETGDDDWFDYCHRIAACVFDQSCRVVEQLGFPRNIIVPIAVRSDTARRLLDADGSTFSGGQA